MTKRMYLRNATTTKNNNSVPVCHCGLNEKLNMLTKTDQLSGNHIGSIGFSDSIQCLLAAKAVLHVVIVHHKLCMGYILSHSLNLLLVLPVFDILPCFCCCFLLLFTVLSPSYPPYKFIFHLVLYIRSSVELDLCIFHS